MTEPFGVVALGELGHGLGRGACWSVAEYDGQESLRGQSDGGQRTERYTYKVHLGSVETGHCEKYVVGY